MPARRTSTGPCTATVPPDMVSGPLRVVIGDRTVDLAPERAYQIGRADDCVVVVEDLRVSRRHLLLTPTGDGWTAQDCQSTGGSWLNGSPVRTLEITVPTAIPMSTVTSVTWPFTCAATTTW